jgi:hypothetical protein
MLTRQGLSQFSLTPYIFDTIFAECTKSVIIIFFKVFEAVAAYQRWGRLTMPDADSAPAGPF